MPVPGNKQVGQIKKSTTPNESIKYHLCFQIKQADNSKVLLVSYVVATPIPVYQTEHQKNEVKTVEQYMTPKQLERKENKT